MTKLNGITWLQGLKSVEICKLHAQNPISVERLSLYVTKLNGITWLQGLKSVEICKLQAQNPISVERLSVCDKTQWNHMVTGFKIG